MADEVSSIKPQRVDSAAVKGNPPAPAKFYSHFLFRALVAVVFFVLIPVFPSIAPEFLTQSFFTESWELIHIIFVGIAVSYGLFSRRYDDSGGETTMKIDANQSYVSKLLQASSVFDEDGDSPTGSFDDGGNKVQAWSSQYFRNEPVVAVANKESSSAFSGRKTDSVSRIGDDKPLLLPVRSLRSRIPDESGDGHGDSRVSSMSYSRSSSFGSSSAPKKPLNWEKKIRSGSLKSRISDLNGEFELSGSLSPSSKNSSSRGDSTRISTESLNERSNGDMDEEDVVVLPSPIPWRSRSGKIEMKKAVNPTPSSTEELDPDRSSMSKTSRMSSDSPPNKAFYTSASLIESQAKRSEDSTRRKAIYRSSPPPPPPPPPVPLYKPSSIKSNSRMGNDNNVSTAKENERNKVDLSPAGKSVRTVRSWQEAAEERNEHESPLSDDENESGDFFGEVVASSDDNEDDSEHDEADGHGGEVAKPENGKEEGGNSSGGTGDDEGPDVDKKADEFIAKFREQIRLQRIESIKRSTGQFSKNSMR